MWTSWTNEWQLRLPHAYQTSQHGPVQAPYVKKVETVWNGKEWVPYEEVYGKKCPY